MRILTLTLLVIASLIALETRLGAASGLALTIYNQNFAVVRDQITLDLRQGINRVRFAEVTASLDPSSVVLRDPENQHQFQVLEQNYRGDPVSQEIMLSLNQGKTIDFEVTQSEGVQMKRQIIPGRVIRGESGMQPIIELNGKLRFGLPGQPIFPALPDETILKPTLHWVIQSQDAAKFDAEVSYVTGEMRWEADYNLVLPQRGDTLDIVGWVTMHNGSGKTFENARIKLMAGDVNKIQDPGMRGGGGGGGAMGGGGRPPVTEKSFDEYHLYTLENATTLLDREKKQVEFVRATEVLSRAVYLYDGASLAPEENWNPEIPHIEAEYGTRLNTKVWTTREFTNSAANHLGLPLPKGRLRLYRRDTGNQMEFIGENLIDHTPRDELIRVFTGSAFDLIGERTRVEFKSDLSNFLTATIDPTTGLPVAPRPMSRVRPWIDESFEITLRNHKKETVEIRVVEHLYRGTNWDIAKKSRNYRKKDAQTIEFLVPIKPDEQQQVSYTVHYTW